jgi:hypothetical protein
MYFFEQYKTCKWWMVAGIGATQLPSACRIPHGYRYVRVAQDVLFIAVRTSMIVNTVYDLNNM